jgi:hypothetical protein
MTGFVTDFAPLPVLPDLGLPQAFSCDIGGIGYVFGVYAVLDVAEADPLETRYDLSAPDATGYLVLRVVQQNARPASASAGGSASTGVPGVVLLRRLVPEPGLVHPAGPLAVRLTKAVVARGNLNGAGSFGSRITIEVAQRWA